MVETIVNYKTATITRDRPSLYHAGKAAGLSDNIIMKLSYIFQWDISFALDLRTGDSFTLMFEEKYVNGEKVTEGDIIAATFTNTGNTYEAVRYTDIRGHTNYYGVPFNSSAISAFRFHVGWLWKRCLERRSQRTRVSWARMQRLIDRYLPPARICHPYPLVRLGVTTQGRSRMR